MKQRVENPRKKYHDLQMHNLAVILYALAHPGLPIHDNLTKAISILEKTPQAFTSDIANALDCNQTNLQLHDEIHAVKEELEKILRTAHINYDNVYPGEEVFHQLRSGGTSTNEELTAMVIHALYHLKLSV